MHIKYSCSKCGGHTYARVDAPVLINGQKHYKPSDYIRCVHCKSETLYPVVNATAIVEAMNARGEG